MSREELPPQFQGAVRLQSALMGLALAFREKYGDEALEVAKTFTKQLGIKIGNQLREKAGVKGLDWLQVGLNGGSRDGFTPL